MDIIWLKICTDGTHCMHPKLASQLTAAPDLLNDFICNFKNSICEDIHISEQSCHECRIIFFGGFARWKQAMHEYLNVICAKHK